MGEYRWALMFLMHAVLFAQEISSDCTWSTNNDLPEKQALYIKPDGSKDIHGFHLPQSGDIVNVNANEEVLFACPGGQINSTGASELTLICVDGKTYETKDGNKQYTFKYLSCSKDPVHTARRSSDNCEVSGDYYLIEIGFVLSGNQFYKLLEVCFDETQAIVVYSKFIQTKNIAGHQSDVPRPDFMEGDFYPSGMSLDQLYTVDSETDAVAKAVGSYDLAQSYIKENTDYFMARGHITAKADFVYGAHQRATFWYVNAAPQWQTFNGGNWNNLEMSVRDFAAQYDNDLTIYTGIHDILELKDVNDDLVPIYLYYDDNDNGMLKSPYIYWKVVYDESTNKGVAFVGLNNPYLDNPGNNFYLCDDVCDQISWVNWKPNDQYLGYAYCCDVEEFSQNVPEMPDLPVSGLLT